MKYKFFWNGIFSNWHKHDFWYKGICFNCAEQAMMYHKALFFNDQITAILILNAEHPKDQKALGRQVKNFNPKQWDEVKYDLVKEILHYKFTDNLRLLNQLLAYKGYLFVEASPYDRIWGIGYEEKDALQNIDNWGENLLGKILTELSNEL